MYKENTPTNAAGANDDKEASATPTRATRAKRNTAQAQTIETKSFEPQTVLPPRTKGAGRKMITPQTAQANRALPGSRTEPAPAEAIPAAPIRTDTPANVARTTKKSQLIDLLRRSDGADIAGLSAKLGWKDHTTRAALSGLRKAGFRIEVSKASDANVVRIYRITPSSDLASITQGGV